jgi:hypothetical protein
VPFVFRDPRSQQVGLRQPRARDEEHADDRLAGVAPEVPLAVKSLVVPGENYGIVSHGAIGGVWVGGSKLTLPYVLGNIIVQQSWR